MIGLLISQDVIRSDFWCALYFNLILKTFKNLDYFSDQGRSYMPLNVLFSFISSLKLILPSSLHLLLYVHIAHMSSKRTISTSEL